MLSRKQKIDRLQRKLRAEQKKIQELEQTEYLLSDVELFTVISELQDSYFDDDKDISKIHKLASTIVSRTERFIGGEIRQTRTLLDCFKTAQKIKYSIPLPDVMGLEEIHLEKGTNMVIGAKSGVGKTSAMCNLAFRLMVKHRESNMRIILFSLEMTEDQIFIKLFQIFLKAMKDQNWTFSQIANYLQKPDLNPGMFIEADAFSKIFGDKIKIVNAENMTASEICKTISAHSKDEPFTLACIDYMQIVQPELYTLGQDRRLQVSTTSQILTRFAKEQKLSFVILSQLNGMDEFMESKQILNDAGVAILLTDEERDGKEKKQLDNALHLSVLKSRFSARFQKKIMFDKKTGTITGELG